MAFLKLDIFLAACTMCACAVWLFVGSASTKGVVLGSPLSSGEQLMKQLQPSALMGRDFAAPAQHYPGKWSPQGGGAQGTLRRAGSWAEPSERGLPQDCPLSPAGASSELCPPP